MHGHAVGLRDLGATMAPLNAFLTITGIETLPLRMERHCANAQAVAEHPGRAPRRGLGRLRRPAVQPVSRAGEKYLPKGAGSVFTFGVKGGYEAGVSWSRRSSCSRIWPMSATRAR